MSTKQEAFRSAMRCFATGITIVTVDDRGQVHGMTANAFTSVSLDPMLVLVCVDRKAQTHAHLQTRQRFGINMLSEHQRRISEHYADEERDRKNAEQLTGAKFDRTDQGTPVLEAALAYLECRLMSEQDAGDHTIFIAEVEDVVIRGGRPLLFFQSRYWTIGGEVK